MEIKRDKYLRDLEIRMGNGMVKFVTGVRRCGKTYLLFKLFKQRLSQLGIDDGHIIAVQLDAQEKASLLAVPDSFKKVLVVGDDVPTYYDDDGILTVGLLDFLVDPTALDR